MKIIDLKLNPENPRKIDIEKLDKLKKSIKEFPKMMKLRPIVIDNDNIIIGGNMRLKALTDLGYKEIPDDWVKKASELTEEEKQRFIIADNVGFGEWDMERLEDEWDSKKLCEWGIDIYDDDEIKDIEEIINFNESINFIIKCDNISELEELQSKLNISTQKITYNNFISKIKLLQ